MSPTVNVRRRPVRTGRRVLAVVATYAFLVLAALVTLGPLVLSAMTSVKTPLQFASEQALALPSPSTFASYRELFGPDHFFIAPIVVTAQMTAVILVAQLTFSVLAAYAFARIEFPGRDAIFWVYLATMMVPQVATLVPLYSMMVAVGLRNTFWSLVLPTMLGSPYGIFLLRGAFRAVPDDLLAAARLDGCGHLRILRHVVWPLSRPVIATLTVITVVAQWNSFLWPRVITSGSQWSVVTVATAALQSQYNGNWTLVTAATTVSLLPLVLLYLVAQKQVVRSISLTGLK